jgi:transposase
MALELSSKTWLLGFSASGEPKMRRRSVAARELPALVQEITKAKTHFRLPKDAAMVSCYEAGRDGFWLHRHLGSIGVRNLVVDSASIEVNRRHRRAKTDRLDAGKLVQMLKRYEGGERDGWSVVNGPSVEEEDQRQLHRELGALKKERTQHINRIKGLLALHGVRVTVDSTLPRRLSQLRSGAGGALPPRLVERLGRECKRLELVEQQVREIDRERRRMVREGEGVAMKQVRQLMELRGIGIESSWTSVGEVFGWRQIRNRRQVGAISGLAPTPYASGQDDREQGISKAGNKRVRAMAVELAWCWLRWQPDSALSKWFERRFASGKRTRRIGIVALARRLLVELWRYLETGAIPEGAVINGARI